MNGFKTARSVLGFVQLLGWCVVAAGAAFAVFAFQERSPGAALMVSAGVCLAGLFLVAQAQIGLAVIVTAENTAAMLEQMRGGARAATDPANSGRAQATDAASVKVYKGYTIGRDGAGFRTDGVHFDTVLAAERYIDSVKSNR